MQKKWTAKEYIRRGPSYYCCNSYQWQTVWFLMSIFSCFLRSLHQQMSQSMQRSTFLWLSWGTGTSWKHKRSDDLSFFCHSVLLLFKCWTFVFFLRCLAKICRWSFMLHLTQRSIRASRWCCWSLCSQSSWAAAGVGHVRGEVVQLQLCLTYSNNCYF